MTPQSPAARVERDLICIGGSFGALQVLKKIAAGLPEGLAASVLVVVHQAESQPGKLAEVLSNAGPLPAEHARDGEPIELGRIYVAPNDFHLLVETGGTIRLSHGPKQNRFRPAIDPLFRTAARVFGSQVIGVLLSGLLDDGSFGLMQIKRFGGAAVVQDPRDAEAGDMPASAIHNVRVDHVVPGDEIAATLSRLVREPVPDPQASQGSTMSQRNTPSSAAIRNAQGEHGDIAEIGDAALTLGGIDGAPSGLTCPGCGGALWERNAGGLIFYRCHVGHSYTADSMAAEHESELEQTLWASLRMFQENAALHDRMATKADERGDPMMSGRWRERAEESRRRTEIIRQILLGRGGEPSSAA